MHASNSYYAGVEEIGTPVHVHELSLFACHVPWAETNWLADVEESNNTAKNDDEPDWIIEHARRERRRAILEKRRRLEERLARVRAEEERRRRKLEDSRHPSKRLRPDSKRAESQRDTNATDEHQFELDDYDSGDEQGTAKRMHGMINHEGFSADTLALLEKLKSVVRVKQEDDDSQEDDVRIFYCSRTHSQLTQFAQELRRVTFPPSIPPEDEEEGNKQVGSDEIEEGTKHIVLGSRKTLCINPKVQALGNPVAINERCLDLQKPGVAAAQKCPFLPSKDNETLSMDFRDHALAKVRDIEDIGKIGQQIGVCPYYAARSVVKHSEIVTLPYPLLLQKSAREALNISLKDHVIIIDEAHNLMDVISNIHSVAVSLSQLRLASTQLTTYAKKFKTRLQGKNRVYVAQVIRLVAAITQYLESILQRESQTEGSVQISDIMSAKGVDQINPHKLSRYLHESKLARKVDGYVEYSEKSREENRQAPKQSVPVLFQVQSFLLPLMNPSAEGRLFYEKVGSNDVYLKYLLLDPTNHFRETVEDARAVILAGGTMSPMEDYADHLFSYLEPGRLRMFSYGHVIPKDNLMAAPILKGLLETELDFTYGKRDSENMLIDLGRTIVGICNVVPDGVVAFFPSYDLLTQVIKCWKKPLSELNNSSILDQLGRKKIVFHESLDRETNTDDLLENYSSTIDKGAGALLLSVMGGKLSEGINFSDSLGRGVIVVGLPFPNIRSAVMQAKIQHVERKAYESCAGTEEEKRARGKAAGREFYENVCMRTVNQCIGRAIRHRNDYAAILMLDRRYGTPRIQNKLPSWIRQSLVSSQHPTRRTIGEIASFFHRKRNFDTSTK
ncbi:hypothetical protein VTO42DRAFT_3747 [Malbranchea cinnamomea]